MPKLKPWHQWSTEELVIHVPIPYGRYLDEEVWKHAVQGMVPKLAELNGRVICDAVNVRVNQDPIVNPDGEVLFHPGEQDGHVATFSLDIRVFDAVP